MNAKKLTRKIHYWAALICAIPVIIVIMTGILLMLKKEFEWIQPSTIKGQGKTPYLELSQILPALSTLQEVQVSDWNQIKRIDLRPNKGIMKIQIKGGWEVQMDHQTGQILKVAYRRSDLIEAIHDGSFFHDLAKLGVFLPSAFILLALWITGLYLFAITELAKHRSRTKQRQLAADY